MLIKKFWDGRGQKWVWPVWSRGSKTNYLNNESMEWTDFLHTGGNSGKLKVVLMIFGWAWSKIGMTI